jgi:hypothetical protein
MLVAFVFNLFAYVIYMAIAFGVASDFARMGRGGEPILAILIVTTAFLVPSVFILVGSIMLGSLRGKGLVIVGCIMAFVTSAELVVYLALNFPIMKAVFEALGLGVPIGLIIIPLLHYLSCILALVFGIGGGIRGLLPLGYYDR